MSAIPTLYVIDGDYGLLSLDIESLQSILYARLNRTQIDIKPLKSVKSCALYTAPSLQNGKVQSTTFEAIKVKLKNKDGLESELSSRQRSETMALCNLVTTKFKPILEFMYWLDQRNFEEFTSRWFMKVLPLPFNYSYVNRKRKFAQDLIETLYPLDVDMDLIKEFIYKSATHVLATLSTRLGTAKYFFGDTPKTLDILVYSYLAPIIKLPFPSNEVGTLVAMWPNLGELVKRIDSRYFPELKKEIKYLKNDVENHKQNDDDISYMALFILVVSATCLTVGFAVKRGIKLPKLL